MTLTAEAPIARDAAVSGDELVARAAALVPLLRSNAAETEQNRRVVEENIEAIADAGLYRLAVPARFGGHESDFTTFLRVSVELARGDGSTAWVVTLMNVCCLDDRPVPRAGAGRGVGADPDARVSGVLAPTSTSHAGRRRPGRHRAAGASTPAAWHAQWAVLGVPVTDENGEVVDQGLALIPAADLTIEDIWYVAGMRGTASNCLVATDVFVPSHRVMSVPPAIERRLPDAGSPMRPLFRSAFVPVLTLVLAGPQLGMGQAALNLVTDKAAKKPISYTFFETQAESVAFQLQSRRRRQQIDAASLICYRAAADIDDAAARGEYLDYLNRARVRADTGTRCRTWARRSPS